MDNSTVVDAVFNKTITKSQLMFIGKNQDKIAFVKYNDNIQIENR